MRISKKFSQVVVILSFDTIIKINYHYYFQQASLIIMLLCS